MRARELLAEAKSLLNEEVPAQPSSPAENLLKHVFSIPRDRRLSFDELQKIKELKIKERKLEDIVSRCEGEMQNFRKRELDATRHEISQVLHGPN